MARLQRTSERVNSTAETAIAVLGQAILFGSSNQTACQLSDFVGMILTVALRVLPPVIVSAWQALQGFGCEHTSICTGLAEISGCCWRIILHLAGAV